MDNFRLSNAPTSAKLLVTALLCTIGLIYITLLVHIWIDTQMKPSLVAEAYGGMEYIELTDHAHKYLPYYSVYLFALPIIMFMFTSYPEKLKRFFAIFPFLVIVADIGSMYLIPYLWRGFAYVLWLAGTFLALTFLSLFVLNLYDIWLRKATR
ncbi:MAG: hypothetical protein ACE5IT_02820 [bacterium]